MNVLRQDKTFGGLLSADSEPMTPARPAANPLLFSELDILRDEEDLSSFDSDSGDARFDENWDREVEAAAVSLACPIVVVESRTLLRESLARTLRSAFPGNVEAFSNVAEALRNKDRFPLPLVLLSTPGQSDETVAHEIAKLAAGMPAARIVVVGQQDDLETALSALNAGAKGYLTANMTLQVVVEAMKFVIAGGVYLPAEWVLAAKHPNPHGLAKGGISSRERAVIHGIRQGKPNKVIAYELNMCESTVKVHVRHVMKKLRARNRTEVAIKAAAIFAESGDQSAGALDMPGARETELSSARLAGPGRFDR